MSWRPDKDWIKHKDFNSPSSPHQGGADYDINGKFIDDLESFEQGADAMLEALRKHGVKGFLTSVGTFIPSMLKTNFLKRGYQVFIPDEE
jgi:hypothetical protein